MASSRKPDPYLIDEDNAPLTDEEIKDLRPAKEVFTELGIPMPRPRGRPPKPDRKVQVTIRLDPDVLEAWRSTGPGWQTRMREVPRRAIEEDA